VPRGRDRRGTRRAVAGSAATPPIERNRHGEFAVAMSMGRGYCQRDTSMSERRRKARERSPREPGKEGGGQWRARCAAPIGASGLHVFASRQTLRRCGDMIVIIIGDAPIDLRGADPHSRTAAVPIVIRWQAGASRRRAPRAGRRPPLPAARWRRAIRAAAIRPQPRHTAGPGQRGAGG